MVWTTAAAGADRHILKLLVVGRFPRLWAPDREQRDLRQLVLHRHKLVLIRSRVKNELQHLSLHKGMQRKRRRLWSHKECSCCACCR